MAMVEFTTELKKWGNSQGILIPKKYAEKLHGGKVTVRVIDDENPMEKYTGTIQFDESLDELMREVDGIWDD